jgi:hypothetical protein
VLRFWHGLTGDFMPQIATQSLTLNVASQVQLAITTTSVPLANEFTPYSVQLAATGGTIPYTWSISTGALPAGLSLSSSGLISGTPTVSGSFSFTAQVVDSGA